MKTESLYLYRTQETCFKNFPHSQDEYPALCLCYNNLYKLFTGKDDKVLNKKNILVELLLIITM